MGEQPPIPRASALDPRPRVDRILSDALAEAERTMASAGRRSSRARLARVAELHRQRASIAASARETQSATLTAARSLAAAADRLAALARAEPIAPPQWPSRARDPVEVKLSEVREISFRFAPGEGR